MRFFKNFSFLLIGVLSAGLIFGAFAENASVKKKDLSVALEQLVSLYSEDLDQIEPKLKQLIHDYPNYKLIKLLYADWLSMQSGVAPDQEKGIKLIRSELLLRHRAFLRRKEIQNKIPRELIEVSSQYSYAVAVDLSYRRLYLFKVTDKGLSLFKDFYVTIGKEGFNKFREGDKKTPIGAYLFQKYIKPNQLNSKRYGNQGAWTLDYPNGIDRFEKRKGYGIWLHGTPIGTLIRSPFSSNGCLSVSDDDLAKIKRIVKNAIGRSSVPIVIAKEIHWLTPEEHVRLKKFWKKELLSWIQDWTSLKYQPYINHYSHQFQSKKMDYKAYDAYKKRVNASKKYIKVRLNRILILESEHQNGVRILFHQTYQSSNYKSQSDKEVFFKKEGDEYKIILEDGLSKKLRTIKKVAL